MPSNPTPVHPKATRRVPLTFDANGDPTYNTVCSPKSFRMRALAVVMPRHVIPVIFVPGVMGTNLCTNEKTKTPNMPAWRPPNGELDGLGQARRHMRQKPKERQLLMNPETTKVDTSGHISMPRNTNTLTKEEAHRRGWGELHWDSYCKVLSELESALNDQYINPGTNDAEVMSVWKLAKSLKKIKIEEADTKNLAATTVQREEDILKTWNPIKGDTPPLTEAEFTRMDDYYYPVWACGYNWMESNEVSATRLVSKIKEILAWYDRSKYFIPEGRVIIVTHSMGGMVARRAAQLIGDKILGVVNSVQPVGGAPVVYRRFRAGTEVGGIFDIPGAALATIVGWDAADITCVMANSPGTLELLPTKHFPSGWLRFEHDVNGKSEPLFSLPKSDPYSEIYATRIQNVWWGMIDESLLDPAEMTKKDNVTPWESYKKSITKAKNFHDNVELFCHPNTYAHYGADASQNSFGSVHWASKFEVPSEAKESLIRLTAKDYTKLGKVVVAVGDKDVEFHLENKAHPKKDDDPNAGDGTVPVESAALIGESAMHVFRMKGFEHGASYNNNDVIESVLYCLGKIIQGAKPAKDLPQSKGESCSVPNSATAPSSDSPDSVSPPLLASTS